MLGVLIFRMLYDLGFSKALLNARHEILGQAQALERLLEDFRIGTFSTWRFGV